MALILNIIRSKNRNSLLSLISLRRIVRPEFQAFESSSCTKFTYKQPSYTTGAQNFNETKQFKAFKAKQAKMQCDDGYPVHLKGGLFDKILYHITVGLCIIGLFQCFQLFYDLAKT